MAIALTATANSKHWRLIGLILAGSIAIKLLLILYVRAGVNGDLLRAVNFGYGIHEGVLSIRTHFVNSKTWVGPVLWYQLFDLAGPYGLKLFNMLAFLALLGVQYLTGRRFYHRTTLLLALFLLAFYAGSHRNVMAGEPDDMMAALFFATGLLVFLERDGVAGASLLMGLGLVFKFWVVIVFSGFAVFLLWEKRWRELALATAAFLVPFLIVNLVDGFASLSAILWSVGRQSGNHSWGEIGWRLLSTGLLPAAVASAWAVLQDPSRNNRLFFLVPIAYFAYILVLRDVGGVSSVMMLCMVYFSFLIAQFLLRNLSFGSPRLRRAVLASVLAAYVFLSAGLASYGTERSAYQLNLHRGGVSGIWKISEVQK